MNAPHGRSRLLTRVRKSASVAVLLLGIGPLLISASAWPEDGLMDIMMSNVGMVLLLICAFGRLWSSLFIAGYKNERLITAGPYSLVRNPLYVFSFLGTIGLGLVSESFIVTGLLTVPFAVWFPAMVREEEGVLAERHPVAWPAYVACTPRFVPAFRVPIVPESYLITPRLVGRAIADAIWFPLAALGLEGIEMLHNKGVLPTLWMMY